MGNLLPLTAATTTGLPTPCTGCVFWQHDRLVTDARRREAWAEGVERRHGSFGRILSEGGEFRGMVQYGPASAFPRALALPAGPPARDAALVTCMYIAADDPVGTCERLLLEALADLKGRGFAAVEAFALGYSDEVLPVERVAGHHTLFDRETLEGLGFAVVRRSGQVALMRIRLGGLDEAPRALERALRALRGPEPGLSGAPA